MVPARMNGWCSGNDLTPTLVDVPLQRNSMLIGPTLLQHVGITDDLVRIHDVVVEVPLFGIPEDFPFPEERPAHADAVGRRQIGHPQIARFIVGAGCARRLAHQQRRVLGAEEAGSRGDEPPDAQSFEGAPIGAYLAAQRRLRGISVEQLAAQTRIPLRSLERLEAGSFDANIDGFVRGFVRTVAEALGLDPEETVARTRCEPEGDSGAGSAPHLSLRRVFLTVALVVGAGLLLGLVQMVAISPPRGFVTALDPVVVRRDPVRALAEAQAVAGLAQSASAVLATMRSEEPGTRERGSLAEPEAEHPGPEVSRPVAR